MAARTATSTPQDDGNESDKRFGFIRAALNGPMRLADVPLRLLSRRPHLPSLKLSRTNVRFGLKRPSAFAVAALAVAAAVLFVGILTYYGAQEFSGRAADTRASNEAMSFAEHSSRLATGDAFDGYIQILRYADDPIVNAKVSSSNDRASALQRLLYLNVNKFISLTIADRSGLILATTDSTLSTVKGGTTFSETRANLAPANSDVILPEAGRHGYVEYSAPLRDPDGTVWGILVGRADPAILWKGTLAAAVDGGRNVIINSEGLFAAGVPDDLLRQPWHGRPLSNGGVRADIAGTDSICGLAPIGRDTQIDRGLNVASCLPASLIQVERHAATDKQGLITLAGVVLAIVVASVLLRLFIRGGGPVAAAASPAMSAGNAIPALDDLFAAAATRDTEAAVVDIEPDIADDPVEVAAEVDAIETAAEELDAEVADGPESDDDIAVDEPIEPEREQVPPPPPPDVDALMLISAYEGRNARLALRLRETVQAKMLVAATEAEAAFKLIETDAETAGAMHGHAMEELDHIRRHELRSIGQEIFPGLTRLGLPGALRAMRKEFVGNIGIELDVDATTDSVAGGASRSSLAPALRLVMYRFALESVRALSAAGADACAIVLRREGTQLTLAISCGGIGAASFDRDVLAPSELAAEAYAGTVEVTAVDEGLLIILAVPAPTAEADPVIDLEKAFASFEAEDEAEDPEQTPVYAEVAADIDDDDADAVDDEQTGAPTAITPDTTGVVLPPRTGLAAAVEALQAEFFGSMIVALDIAPDLDGGTVAAVEEPCGAIEDVVRESLRALQAADARQCDLTLTRAGSQIMLSILSAVGDADFDDGLILAHQATLDRLEGYLAVDQREGNVAISAEVSALGADTQQAAEPEPSDEDGAQHAA